jgi:signal transduction histidine kinase
MLDALRPLRSGRDDRDGGACGDIVLTVDAAAGALLDASAEGWRTWGLDPATTPLPVALDRAMPALHRLAHAAGARFEAVLTFWTARGVLQLNGVAQRAGEHRFVVRAPAGQAAGRQAATRADGVGLAVRRPGLPEATATARLAHELKTPLNAAIAYAEALKDERFGPMVNARYRDYARNIYDSARHALGVIDGMLGSGGQRAVPELTFAELGLEHVVAHSLAVARPLAEAGGLALDAQLEARLPRVIADEVSLRQMLLNLLTNAIKFGRPGDRITVRAACELDGPLRIVVADTGPGIDPQEAAAIAGRRPNAGLGIGLPLTRALAEANGAALTIDSTPGRGTRVTIAFGKNRVVPV